MSILDEALGLQIPVGEKDTPESELNHMVVLDPAEKTNIAIQPEVQTDTWKDYEHARAALSINLEQAQIALKAAVEYVNSAPSPRSFEVLSGLIQTVNACAEQLLALQTKIRALDKSTDNSKNQKSGETKNTFVFLGDPTDVLDKIDDYRNDIINKK